VGGLYFQWHITDICNLRCKHCYQSNYTAAAELDIDGLKKIADSISLTASAKNTGIVYNITGGEPFLKKELFPLCAYLDSLKETREYIIITNGMLINTETISRLKTLKKLSGIKVSLESAVPSVNDSIRGKGSFDNAVKSIEMLTREGIPVTVMFTVMKSNLSGIPGLVKLCREIKADGLIIERFIPMGEGSKIKSEVLSKNEWKELAETILDLAGEQTDKLDIYDWRAFWIEILKDGKLNLSGAECNIGKSNFCIMPNADVYPCRRFGLNIGNILQEPLEKIIDSPVLNNIMNGTRKGKCKECEYLDCRGCPALAYHLSGDYLAEDTQCYK